MGSPISVGNADEHIFGVVVLNDWSGNRDTFIEIY